MLTLRGRYAEAGALYRAARDVLLGYTSSTHEDVRRTYPARARPHDAWGKRDSVAVYWRLAQPPGFAPP